MIGAQTQPGRGGSRPAHWMMLIAVLAACVGFRVLALARSESIAPDGTIYIAQARQMLQQPGAGVDHYKYHPGYAMLVAPAGHLLGAEGPVQWQYVGSGVSIAMSAVALLGLFFLARQVTSTEAALVSTALFGLGAQFVETGSDVVSDPTALAMGLCAMALTVSGARRAASGQLAGLGFSACGGLLLGYGYLTRPEILALLAILPVAALLIARRQASRHRRLVWANIAVLLIATAVPVAPYAVLIGGLTRKKGLDDLVFGGHGPALAQLSVTWGAELVGAVRRVLDRLRVAGGNLTTALVLITLATWVGRYILRLRLPSRVICRPDPLLLLLTLGPLGVWMAMLTGLELNTPAGYISSRHALMPAAALSLLAGPGLETLIQWTLLLRKRLGCRQLARATRIVFVLIAIALALIEPSLEIPHEGKAPLRQVAGRVPAEPRDYWLSHEAAIAYYAGAGPVQFQQPSRDHWQLRDENLQSAQAVWDRAQGNVHPVTFVAVPRWWKHGEKTIRIARQLRADPRFEFIAQAGEGRHGVAVFRIRPR